MGPGFGFCKGVVVVLRRACRCFRKAKILICNPGAKLRGAVCGCEDLVLLWKFL